MIEGLRFTEHAPEMKSNVVFVVSILLLAYCQRAAAQPVECPVCRAEYSYGHCPEAGIDNPPENGIAFTGTVTAARPIACGAQITVDVKRSSSPSLPAAIVIDVKPCAFWSGAIGDTVSAVVSEARKQTGAYAASIRCGGNR